MSTALFCSIYSTCYDHWFLTVPRFEVKKGELDDVEVQKEPMNDSPHLVHRCELELDLNLTILLLKEWNKMLPIHLVHRSSEITT